jgi:hypothetical protein
MEEKEKEGGRKEPGRPRKEKRRYKTRQRYAQTQAKTDTDRHACTDTQTRTILPLIVAMLSRAGVRKKITTK